MCSISCLNVNNSHFQVSVVHLRIHFKCFNDKVWIFCHNVFSIGIFLLTAIEQPNCDEIINNKFYYVIKDLKCNPHSKIIMGYFKRKTPCPNQDLWIWIHRNCRCYVITTKNKHRKPRTGSQQNGNQEQHTGSQEQHVLQLKWYEM